MLMTLIQIPVVAAKPKIWVEAVLPETTLVAQRQSCTAMQYFSSLADSFRLARSNAGFGDKNSGEGGHDLNWNFRLLPSPQRYSPWAIHRHRMRPWPLTHR